MIDLPEAHDVLMAHVKPGPTVSILSTGDELIEIDQVPAGAQIRNSNQCLLDALVRSVCCKPVPLGIAREDRDVLKDRITQGLKADVLCLTGGVSMGVFDFVPAVLEDCGVTFHIRKMNIKPGRPIHFGTTASGTLVFGLPGNPASAFVGFELLVRPALAALEGRPNRFPLPVDVVLCGSVGATRDRRTFVPAHARIGDRGAWTVEPLSWGGSGNALGMATAGALIVRPPHAPALETGARVRAYLLDRMWAFFRAVAIIAIMVGHA